MCFILLRSDLGSKSLHSFYPSPRPLSLCSSEEATFARNALAKLVYQNLFDWLVDAINASLPFNNPLTYIGILDIAGECRPLAGKLRIHLKWVLHFIFFFEEHHVFGRV